MQKYYVVISVSLVAMFAITSFDSMAFAEISLSSHDTEIGPNDRLLVMGTISGDIQSFHPIQLVVYDPLGNVIYRPSVPIHGDGGFKYMITPTLPRFDDGKYTVEASHENLEEKTQLKFTVSSVVPETIFDENMETKVIPEFGTITMMILAVSILSVMIVAAKSKVGFRSFIAR